MRKENFSKILLMALSEPEYARVDYWRAEQKDSKYSKTNFVRKLIDAHDDLLHRIESKEVEFKALNPDAGEPNYGLPLVYETDHELRGHVKKMDLAELKKSLNKLNREWSNENVNQSETGRFLNLVLKGELSDLDIYNKAQALTDDFKEPKLSLLWTEYMNLLNDGASRSTYKSFENWIPEDPFELQYKELGTILNEHLMKSSAQQQEKNIQPIHWLKGEESLRQFIDLLKSAGLIENRETDEIIQEHFYVGGQELTKHEPTKEPQPIIWKSKKVLLAHLIGGLDSMVKTDHLWKTLAPHFHWKGKVPTGLRQSFNDNPFPNNVDVIQGILKKIKEEK